MDRKRHKVVPSTFLILLKDDKVLLQKRMNTGHRDGQFGVPSGHVDEGEYPIDALVREVKEEAGISVNPKDIKHVYTGWQKTLDGDDYVNFIFSTTKWEGTITNNEPDKCSELTWFPIDKLPPNMVDYISEAIEKLKEDSYYGERTMKDNS